MAVKSAIKRYQANFRAEQEGSLLYQELANTVQDANLVELYRRLSETEQRHASIWAKRLQAAGQPVPTYTLGLRMRLLVWMAKRFGVSSVLPFAFGSGWMAVLVSVFLGILGLFIVGIGITLTTGASLLKSGGRQVLLGLLAAAITFGLGWLVGGRLA